MVGKNGTVPLALTLLRAIAALDHDVGGLDVAVDNLSGVRGGQAEGQFPHGFRRLARVQRLLPHAIGQRAALDQRHGNIEDAVDLARIVDRADVRVADLGQGLPFALEAAAHGRVGGHVEAGDLQRHVAVQIGMIGAVDPAHRPLADEAADLITAERLARGQGLAGVSLGRPRVEGVARRSRGKVSPFGVHFRLDANEIEPGQHVGKAGADFLDRGHGIPQGPR